VVRKAGFFGLFVIGLLMFIWGNAIALKAHLADFLLERAWSQSLNSGQASSPWYSLDAKPYLRLKAPEFNIDQIVLDNESGQALAFAPVFLVESAAPGEAGMTAIAAHKNTHFFNIPY